MEAKNQENVTRPGCSDWNCSIDSQMNIQMQQPFLEVDMSQIVLSILHDAAALLAILLNCITLIVLKREKKLELREYLVHLAIADLIFSFKQAFVYLNFKPIQPITCPAWAFSVGLSLFVSMFIMVAIAVSRYYALLQPTRRFVGGMLSKSRILLSIWLFGIIFCWPLMLFYPGTEGFKNTGLYFYCDPVAKGYLTHYQGFSFFIITFVVPFVFLFFLFWRIKNYLYHYQVPGAADVARDRAIRQVVNMLAVVVALFAALWLPPQIYMLLHEIVEIKFYLSEWTHVFLHLVFGFMSQAHSCVNPIIYCFMSTNFREELINLMPWLVRFPCFTKAKRKDRERLNNLLITSNRREILPKEAGFALRSHIGEEDHIEMTHQIGSDLI